MSWKKGPELLEKMHKVQCVSLKNKIYVSKITSLNWDAKHNTLLHVLTSTDLLGSWTTLQLPVSSSGLTTYHSQLVLVGGMDPSTQKATNKLLASDTGAKWQVLHSLPPLHSRRISPTVLNTGIPEFLVVAGGRGEDISVPYKVEVLVEGQWLMTDEPLFKCPIQTITLHNRSLYSTAFRGHEAYYCSLKSLIASCSPPDASKEVDSNIAPLWKKLPLPGISSNLGMVSFHQRLMMCTIGQKQCIAYSPSTQSWVHVGEHPLTIEDFIGSLVLPTGEWVVFSNNLHRTQSSTFKVLLTGMN